MRHYHQGRLKLQHPKKYKGDPNNVWFRSGWEKKMYNWCDTHDIVLEWGSEELAIPYISPVDGRQHRYFPDFFAKMQTKTGIKTFLVEIKPFAQTKLPKPQKRQTKKYTHSVMTYAVNDAKWEAASKFCEKQGWQFKILTENEIFGAKTK